MWLKYIQITLTNTSPIEAAAADKNLAPVMSNAADGIAGAVKLNLPHDFLLS